MKALGWLFVVICPSNERKRGGGGSQKEVSLRASPAFHIREEEKVLVLRVTYILFLKREAKL